MILDGGRCAIGIESTIVGCTGGTPTLLRPGGIDRAAIERVLGRPLAACGDDGDRPSAPGQLASHYAPRAALRLDAKTINAGEALLAFGADLPEHAGAMLNLSATGDLREAAANLFAHLRALDTSGAATIAVMPVPHEGLGEAINDRLARAAAPR
jgi:L-threonylcarbamoyladenylate synthase